MVAPVSFVVALLALGCGSKAPHVAPVDHSRRTVATDAAPSSAPAPAGAASASPAEAVVVLGRVVGLDGLRAVRTLTDPPDAEVSETEHDVSVLLLEDSRLQGFRMSTGDLLWERTTPAPCRSLLLARSKIYAGCGDKVASFDVTTGADRVVDKGPAAGAPILLMGGSTVAVPGKAGRISLYDAATGRPLVSKVPAELSRAFQRDVLASPASRGICVLGLAAGPRGHLTYRAACYDETLRRQWSQSFAFAADRPASLRQLGPEYLVIDDQESILDPSLPPGPGRGLLVRWRDGTSHAFEDGTFATFENSIGDPLSLDSDVFALTRTLAPPDPARFPKRSAEVVSDRERVFAVIVNGTASLAGLNRSTGHVLFLIPISVGISWRLSVVRGMPVVRTRFSDRWEVTIYDPVTGSPRYRDSRPRARRSPP